MIRMAVLASGSGSNAQRMIEHFHGNEAAEVVLIASDRPRARVVQRAWEANVPCLLFDHEQLKNGTVQRELQGQGIELVVLAGFLRLVPVEMVRAFPGRIINIHPALLPKYGGKGMYGHRVHETVIAAREKESGITVHYVNEQYDEGEHIAQFKCPVLSDDTPETLADRIHLLEHAHYPVTVEAIVRGLNDREGR